VARVGGDEFVVVAELPGRAKIDLAARLESALSAPIHYDGGQRPVHVSVGCVLAQPGEQVRDALERADAAMYRENSAA
jgi:diguanylate cyclase